MSSAEQQQPQPRKRSRHRASRSSSVVDNSELSSSIKLYLYRDEPAPELTPLKSFGSNSAAQIAGHSNAEYFETVGGVRVVKRPINPHFCWQQYQRVWVQARCVNVKARGVMLNGYTLDDSVQGALSDEIAAIMARSKQALHTAARDQEATGYASLEVVLGLDGRLKRFRHAPSWSVHVKQDGSGFIQQKQSNQPAVHFLDALSEVQQPLRGEPLMTIVSNMSWPYCDHYGVPDAISALLEIDSYWQAIKMNREFFLRRGGYRWLVTVKDATGRADATADSKLAKTINYHLTHNAKSDTASDVIVLPLGNREVTLNKLEADLKDLNFEKLIELYGDHILAINGVPPIVAGIQRTGALSGSEALQAKEVYQDETLNPKQAIWDEVLSSLLQRYLSNDKIVLTLNDIKLDRSAVLADKYRDAFERFACTRDEYRAVLGLAAYDERPVFLNDLNMPDEFTPEAIAQRAQRDKLRLING